MDFLCINSVIEYLLNLNFAPHTIFGAEDTEIVLIDWTLLAVFVS